jgi:hypothetical protein
MSKLSDFYGKARGDDGLAGELAALTEAYVAGVIALAAKHGVTLAAADFAPPVGALDDDALEGVSGGNNSAVSSMYSPDFNLLKF